MVNTRHDLHGRVLAPSRVNQRAEVVVTSPSGEQLPEGRMAALGVDPDAPARGPDTATQTYPIDVGGGWYVLSNDTKVRGEQSAIDQQAKLDAAAEQEG